MTSDEVVEAELKSGHAENMPRCDSTLRLLCGDRIVGALEHMVVVLKVVGVVVEWVIVLTGLVGVVLLLVVVAKLLVVVVVVLHLFMLVLWWCCARFRFLIAP